MPNHAAIYLPDPSVLGFELFDQFEELRSYEVLENETATTGVRVVLEAGEVTLNFMPPEQMQPHLQSLSGFVQGLIQDREVLSYAQTRIGLVRLVCGCVIEPGFDEAGTIQAFLFRFNEAVKGLLFFSNHLYDHNGDALDQLTA